MGIRDTIAEALAAPFIARGGVDAVMLESPWASPNHLVHVTPPDARGHINRATAMSVPAVKRARNLIAPAIARCPLEARTQGERAATQPIWMTRTDGVQSPHFRMLWTVDDLIFYGWSLWALERDSGGQVIRADRVPYHLWDFNEHGDVLVNGRPADPSEVCVIPGVDEGLLTSSSDAVRHASELNRLAQRSADTPAAQVLLKQTAGVPLTGKEITELVESFANARRGRNGGIAFANQSIDVEELGRTDAALLIDGRAAASLDVARAVGVPGTMIDAGASGSGTLTYANATSRNLELIDYALAPYMAAVAARLGLDDMVPRGTAVAFDLSDLTAPTIGDMDVPDDDHTPDDTEEYPHGSI